MEATHGMSQGTHLVYPEKESHLVWAVLVHTLAEVQEVRVAELEPLEAGNLVLNPVQQFLSTNCQDHRWCQ